VYKLIYLLTYWQMPQWVSGCNAIWLKSVFVCCQLEISTWSQKEL